MAKDDRTLKSEAKDPARLIKYLKSKGANHNNYKCYSTRKNIERIVNEQAIYLTRGDGWNDLKDGIGFSESRRGYVRFGKCFSFSRSENVAMWMLYGGTNQDGAMLDLTKSQAAKIRETRALDFGYFDDGGFERVNTFTMNSDSDLFFIDVLYCDENNTGCTVKRSDERVDKLKQPPQGEGLLTKLYPWSYENEVRLVFEAPRDQVPENAECIRIPLDMGQDELRKRVYTAPNSTVKGYNRSRLKATINWDICRGCDRVAQK